MAFLLLFVNFIFAAEPKAEILRAFSCTASVDLYQGSEPVPGTTSTLKFTMKDYKSQVVWDNNQAEDQYSSKIILSGHPKASSQKLYGEFVTDGGDEDPNDWRDQPGGWNGLTWFEMYAVENRRVFVDAPEYKEVLRLFLIAEVKQTEAKERKYSVVLRYFSDNEDGEVIAEYGGKSATCTLLK